MRFEIYDRNPIRVVRQSAKRRKFPVVLSFDEVQQQLEALALRERTLVLLDVATGLRMSELFGLKWADVNFYTNEVNVTRSIVMQVVSHCKTEASQKPIPLDPYLAPVSTNWSGFPISGNSIRAHQSVSLMARWTTTRSQPSALRVHALMC